jgi:predicted amidohydrolase
MQDLIVTLVQANICWENTEKNLSHFDHLLGKITGPTDLILLPETFNTGFSINPAKCAEPPDGPTIKFLRAKATKKNAVIMATILTCEGTSCYNRLVCIYPDGQMAAYDKRHLFRLSEEYKLFSSGTRQVVADVKGWKVATIVCYDLRFPVWCKNTWKEGQYGYDLLVCPANWPASRSHVWKTLLAARAIENQAYVAGVNRIGEDGYGTGHTGDSTVFDPRGKTLCTTPENKETIETVTLSAEELQLFRDSFTIGMDWDQFTIKLKS